MKIYCDLDGVLSNFDKGCQKIFDWPRTPRKPMEDISAHLGISKKEFWDTIDSYGEQWWESLEKEDWFDELVQLIKKYDRDFCILSSPSRSHYAASGKVLWLQKHFHRKFSNYIITPAKNKCLLATHNSVLIDDNNRNCKQFVENSGYCVLFPRLWNTNFIIEDPIEYTAKRLKLIYDILN